MTITKREIVSFIIGAWIAAATVTISYNHLIEPETKVVYIEPPKCSFEDVIPFFGETRDRIEVDLIRNCQAQITKEVADIPKEGQSTVTYVMPYSLRKGYCGRSWIEIEAIYENGKQVAPIKHRIAIGPCK